jgi:hypothetical protein
MAFIVNSGSKGIGAQVLQVRLCRADPGLDIVIAKKICDCSFVL